MNGFFRRINLLAISSWIVIAFLLVPLIAILPLSFSNSSLLQLPPPGFSLRWYEAYLLDPHWVGATLNSVIVGSITALISVVLGMAAAYGLSQSKWKGKAALQALILSPLLVPVIVIAVATYSVFARFGLNGSFTGLIISHTIVTFPYTVVVISAALERFDPRLAQMAVSLGATPFRAFVSVTFPIIRAGVIVALLFAFLNSFDELVLSTFIAGPETTTLPKRLWDGIRYELSPVIAAVSSLLILLSCAIIGLSEVFKHRAERMGTANPPVSSEQQ
ncbi:ABC transporter permease [Sinorhizobium meliloti]|uniref:ABC transporter permease n=1 Tax=Rhizobium meliloti TaxID=382 RepID=UPI000FDA082E|nr:ABC transporter permease [Sinorhizobium meliloti]RVH62693.1 ABC transporter permease [Sinorhizobium meliloti]RVK62833.1 ABC transporter permease [Sinorhizobium meliloti]